MSNEKTIFVQPKRALYGVGKKGDIVEIRESEMKKFSDEVWEMATKEEVAKFQKKGGKVKRIGLGSIVPKKDKKEDKEVAKPKAEAEAKAESEKNKK